MSKKPVKISPIMTPIRKAGSTVHGGEPSEFEAVVAPGIGITVKKIAGHNAGIEKTFVMGDLAEYDSYNLSYYGKIVSITDKAVTIQKAHGGQKHRLNLYTFARRNYAFNADKTAKSNLEEMMYL